MSRRGKFLGFVWLLAPLVVAGQVLAGDDREHEEREERKGEAVLGAVERGEIMPLAKLLAKVRPEIGGEIVGIEIEMRDGTWVYELRIVDAKSRLQDIDVDAATGRILSRKRE